MRKFKVWCNNKNEWERDQCFLTEHGGLFQQKDYNKLIPCSDKTHEIFFSTDKKDKNNNEIYAGNIVKVWIDDDFYQGYQEGYIEYDEDFAAYIIVFQCLSKLLGDYIEEHLEVIGHIKEEK